MEPLDSVRETSVRLVTVLDELDGHPDLAVKEWLCDLVVLLMALHGDALQRMLALGANSAVSGSALVDRMGDDPLIGPLLILHRLHPHAMDVRVARALDRFSPHLAATGHRVTMTGLDGTTLHVRIEGEDRVSSLAVVRGLIETIVLAAAPELEQIIYDAAPSLK